MRFYRVFLVFMRLFLEFVACMQHSIIPVLRATNTGYLSASTIPEIPYD
ncbi:MAG: hypothetical protein IPI79_04420 [Moraxellaceae bacterium]|nr:hypothetical protein [Moraxellaceae bacterium]